MTSFWGRPLMIGQYLVSAGLDAPELNGDDDRNLYDGSFLMAKLRGGKCGMAGLARELPSNASGRLRVSPTSSPLPRRPPSPTRTGGSRLRGYMGEPLC